VVRVNDVIALFERAFLGDWRQVCFEVDLLLGS
jgi:hypothetical protein